MTVTILNDIFINPAAPCPKVLSSDTQVILFFYSEEEPGPTDMIRERDILNDLNTAIVKFDFCRLYKFGSPNDEVLPGHPLYSSGLKYYAGQIVSDSPWVKEYMKINSFHERPRSPEWYSKFKHYIFTFQDNTFECLAENYTVQYYNKPMYDVVSSAMHDMFVSEV